jgi:pimeloyl-ACP methyl ester carboxylesterase
MVPFTETIGGLERSWCEAGSGAAPPLVLLHGIGSNAGSWLHQFAGLAAGRRVVAWNAPGYDSSAPLPAERPDADAYAAALGALLDHLKVQRFHLLGHSLGAITAARFARLYPRRVTHLILSSPAQGYGCDPTKPLPPRMQERLDDIETLGPAGMAEKRAARTVSERASPEVIAQARAAMASVGVAGYRQATWLLAQSDLPADLLALDRPIDLICGTEDRVTPIDGVKALAAKLPHAHLTPIEGAGHASYLEYPAPYNAAVTAALGREEKA